MDPNKANVFDIRLLGDSKPWGDDMLGRFVNECVRSRQLICRDPECARLKKCKRFPHELLTP